MVTKNPDKVQAQSSAEFRRNGERDLYLSYLDRVPGLDRGYRVSLARMLERLLDAIGRDAVNLGIADRAVFENRLKATPFTDHGYPGYFRERTALAVRYLAAAAHGASREELHQFLDGRGPAALDGNGSDACDPFEVTPCARPASRTADRRDSRRTAPARRRHSKSGHQGNRPRRAARHSRDRTNSAPRHAPARTAADGVAPAAAGSFQAFEDMLAASLRCMNGAADGLDPETVSRLLDMPIRVLDERTVIDLLNAVPPAEGWRRRVTNTDGLQDAPTPAAIARAALKDALVARLSQRGL